MDTWDDAALDALAGQTGVALSRDRQACAAASEDFGRIVPGRARAVALPRAADEVAAVVAFAAARGLTLTARGRGYSQGGQSLPRDGLSLDLSRMDRVAPVADGARAVECEGGARLRDVVAAAARAGALPRVLPLNLDLTAGGVLSVGGIGSTSHRYGALVANVASLEVVTGEGRVVACDAAREPALFDAARAGLGRVGVITRASLELRAVPARVRTSYFVYDDAATWLGDLRALSRSGGADHVEAFCWAGAKALRSGPRGRRVTADWLYGLHAAFEHDAASGDGVGREALAGLRPWRSLGHDDEEGAAARFPFRYAPRFEAMTRSGAWHQAHPWLEAFVPSRDLAEALPALLDAIPLALGDGHRCQVLSTRGAPPFFALPAVADGDDVVTFAVLPVGVPALLRGDMLAALRVVDGVLRGAGATRYVSGWLGDRTEADWRAHYGGAYDAWRAAGRAYDPRGVFASALLPGGA